MLPDWVRYAQWTTEQLAKQLGIPARKVLEALGRAADREIVHVGSAGILIPTRLGPLPRHMLRNFAPRLRHAHPLDANDPHHLPDVVTVLSGKHHHRHLALTHDHDHLPDIHHRHNHQTVEAQADGTTAASTDS